jgi:hypothetical protein
MPENFEGQNQEQSNPVERVSSVVDNKKEAENLIKEFWESVTPSSELERIEDWSEEITFGDRTFAQIIRRGEDKGKWQIDFRGNHQPLSDKAIEWLRDKGLL